MQQQFQSHSIELQERGGGVHKQRAVSRRPPPPPPPVAAHKNALFQHQVPPPAYAPPPSYPHHLEKAYSDPLDSVPTPTGSPSVSCLSHGCSVDFVQGQRIESIPASPLDSGVVQAYHLDGTPAGCSSASSSCAEDSESGSDVLEGYRVAGISSSDNDTSTTDTDEYGARGRKGDVHKKKKKKKKKKKIYWIKHRVQSDDTLAGLCLRYDVEVSMLKRLNKFTADHFWMKEFLVVPTTDPNLGRSVDAIELSPEQLAIQKEQKQRTSEATLARLCPELSESERRVYLKLHNYNIQKALVALEEDKSWENNGHPVRVPTMEDRVHPRFRQPQVKARSRSRFFRKK